jgi:glyoxylate reductase
MTKKPFKTVVTGNIPVEWTGKLSSVSEIIIWPGEKEFLMPRDYLIRILPEVDAIVNTADVKADAELLKHASKLKIIVNASIGYDNLNIEELTKRGIWACNSPGFFNYPVAEYIIAGMLILSRRFGEADRFVRQGKWNSFEPGRWDGRSLREMSLGIIGMGAIGMELMKLAQGFGMEVRYFDINNQTQPGFTNLDELLAKSDFVSVNVPLTQTTRHMVNHDFINKLKEDAVLINTSRGSIVKQDVLIKALQSGRIKGAILDVFENEPQVPDALKKLENVFLTPHIAGGTKSARKKCMESVFMNVYNVLTGSGPVNQLNNIIT